MVSLGLFVSQCALQLRAFALDVRSVSDTGSPPPVLMAACAALRALAVLHGPVALTVVVRAAHGA